MLSSRINTDLTDSKGSEDQQSVREKCKGEGSGKLKELADIQKDKFQLARRNTIKTLLIVGCGFIICWTQNQVLYLLHNLGYPVDFNGTYFQYTVLMGFLNCTVNPFIYLAQYRDYQMALKLFHNKRQHHSHSQALTLADADEDAQCGKGLSSWFHILWRVVVMIL